MSLHGQASGAFTESSSALRVLHKGVNNSIGVLTSDGFTQANPPFVTTVGTISSKALTLTRGVLSGSVCFTRPDVGSNYIGGPNEAGTLTAGIKRLIRPLGVFLNTAVGNSFENTPGPASGKNTYASSQGSHANGLYETFILDGTNVTNFATGAAITYIAGMELVASRNGYLMPRAGVDSGNALQSFDVAECTNEVANGAAASTTIAIVKMPPDSVQNELVYDQRI